MITRIQRGCPAEGWWLAGVLLAWLSVATLTAADVELPLLKSGTDVFTNVTVYGQSKTDLFIRHARGFGNVKISSLDNPTLRLLKLGGETPEEKAAGTASGKAAATVANLKAKLGEVQWKTPTQADVSGLISRVRPSPDMLVKVMAVAAVVYLLICACMKLICQNAGSKAGLLIWFPVLQMFPLLRAAKMSAWWFVAFLIPLVGVVAHIVWCVKISKACGKGALMALLLILPGVNLLGFLYLALSKGNSEPAEQVISPSRQAMVLGEA
jgi:hypothetical protein